jgi:hypothetical protein
MTTTIDYNGGTIHVTFNAGGSIDYHVPALGTFETVEEAKAAIDGQDAGFDSAFLDHEPSFEELYEEDEVA